MGNNKINGPARNNTQETGFISEGNPNTQEEPINIPVNKPGKQPPSVIQDQQAARVVEQAIKDGKIALDGHVDTVQQMNLASNTAKAVGVVDKIENDLEVVNKK